MRPETQIQGEGSTDIRMRLCPACYVMTPAWLSRCPTCWSLLVSCAHSIAAGDSFEIPSASIAVMSSSTALDATNDDLATATHAEPEMEVEAAPTEAEPDEELDQDIDDDNQERDHEENSEQRPVLSAGRSCLPTRISQWHKRPCRRLTSMMLKTPNASTPSQWPTPIYMCHISAQTMYKSWAATTK